MNTNKKRLVIPFAILAVLIVVVAILIYPDVNLANGEQNQVAKSEHTKPNVTLLNGYGFDSKITWPELQNVSSDERIVNKVERLLSYENIAGQTLEETISNFEKCQCGIIGANYKVNFDRDNILDVSFTIKHLGPYPEDSQRHYQIDLAQGELIKINQVIVPGRLDKLANLCDQKLQNNIVRKKQSVDEEGAKIFYGKEFVFTARDLESFSITEEGIIFHYSFGFPHVIKAAEPESEIFFSYKELNDFILEGGYLEHERE